MVSEGSDPMSAGKPVHVVVLGAGFAGLTFCQTFRHPSAVITLVDRTNHHLFQPLLYQVATAGLSAPEIAAPIRSLFSDRPDVTVLMEEVEAISLRNSEVRLTQSALRYDYLVIALGGVTSYFGHPEWEQHAPGLKSLDDAMKIRGDVLYAFEQAENEPDRARRAELMTLVVVGGGPTGVELAGAFAELARTVLARDFRRANPALARVVLIEAGPRLLAHLPPSLSESARQQLADLGVDVWTSAMVQAVRHHEVELADGRRIRASNIIWAAGVSASPLTRTLGVSLDRAGRIQVTPELSLPGHHRVFAIGDIALVLDEEGRPVPGVSPAAMQMARHVARMIRSELDAAHGVRPIRTRFKYWDKGTMATIGRSAAVARIGALELSGIPAWIAWLSVHLIFLIGFRNKLAVLLQWAYSYFAYKRGARIIHGRMDSGDALTRTAMAPPKNSEAQLESARPLQEQPNSP
jgi:NADH dehydrogenase